MERPAAPAPPKPCRPILDEDPLFPRYKIRGVLAAEARRPQRFGGRDAAAGPWGTGPCLPNPVRTRRGLPGCRGLHSSGEGYEVGIQAVASGDAAARCGSPRSRQEGAEVPGGCGCESVWPPSPSKEMLLMLRSPPISSRTGRRAGSSGARSSGSGQL